MTTARRRGYSPTTIVLIVVLLGAVIGAARLVTPPPAGPPEVKKETPKQQSVNSARIDKLKIDEVMRNKVDIKKHQGKNLKPVEDPNAIKIESSYFLTTKPGAEGIKEVDVDMARKRLEFEKFKREQAEQNNGAPPAPPVRMEAPSK